MTFRISHMCLLPGGFVVGIALTSTGSGGYVFVVGRDVLDVSYLDPAAGATLAAVVAVLVTVLVRARRELSALSFAGFALLGVARSTGPWDVDMYLGGVAAGLLLGGLVGLCATADRAWLQTALATGVLAGVLLGGPIERLRTSLPRRYADYLPGPTVDAAALAVLALTAVVLAVALRSGDFGERADPAVSRRAVVAGIVVPLVGLVLCWWFVHRAWDVGSGGEMRGRWVFGIVLVAVVIAAALWLEDRTGIVLLAAMALVATGGIGRSAFPDSWPWLLVPAALALAGTVLGRHFPRPVLGIAALAVVAASTVFEHPPWDDLHLGATWLLLPLAATYTFASSLPSSGPVTWAWTSTGVSVAAVVACGLTAAYLGRRRI
ncbi:hypothetical protein [Rhodococcus sp. T7]|uniref:hypothetical protein n=1 Tax=Rhodococcus sp. T7 TaxID=627444 RepID=UPI0013572C8C|nr:hypothetical protein [Rhodococcus sp. T7]